jgi:glycosyltransferase involved in cell wall biosynthesis
MKKLLIITYYWPPSGGAGVQRWLKIAKYLSQKDVEVFVLTVDENYASFPNLDSSLEKDIVPELKVFKTKATNYFKFYEKAVGKENVPKAGYSNVNAAKKSNKLISTLRSHLFIPDPRKGWNRYAYAKAIEIIEKYDIKNVVTTSPPHSTQLVGNKLKEKFPAIKWIADMRDPWTDIYYYKLLGHSKYSHSIDRAYEKQVLENADVVTTVSYGLKEMFLGKRNYVNINEERINVITNGFDSADFDGKANVDSGKFTITYTGTMSEQYSPQVFFDAYSELIKEFSEDVHLKFVGKVSDEIASYARSLGVSYEFVSQVPHDEVVDHQLSANLLLLVIPDVENSKGIITGKLFEYLASRNQVIVVGPKDGEAATFVAKADAGKTFARDEKEAMLTFLREAVVAYKNSGKQLVPEENVKQFDRSFQADEFKKLLT